MGLKTVEAGPFHLNGAELLRLRVLIDRSVVEVFANDRQSALRRIYPSQSESGRAIIHPNGREFDSPARRRTFGEGAIRSRFYRECAAGSH